MIFTGAIDRVIRTWDSVVDRFLDGRPSMPPQLQLWHDSNRGTGEGAVELRGLPEPYLGREPLDGQ